MKLLTARWQPPSLTTRDLTVIAAAALVQSGVLRGLDYIRGAGVGAPEYAMLTAAYPMWLTGTVLLVAAVVGLGGMIGRCHVAVWAAHATTACVYLVGLSLTTLITIVADPDLSDPIRTPGLFALAGLIHAILALRTGPRPLAAEGGHPVEQVVEPGEELA